MIHAYKLGGYNIILDINSGSIHSVDEVAYDAVLLLEHSNEEEVKSRLMSKYPKLSGKDIAELFHEINSLKSQKKLFAKDGYATAGEENILPLKALCLNVAHECNMSCAYCFAGGRGDYGGGEGLMSLEVGKGAIDFLIKNSLGQKTLDIDFFGGEPLLNWETVKQITGYARSREGASGKKFRFTLTTNGVLLSEDVINFTNREMHNVVLSLDGRPEINDHNRKLPDGSGSYHEVLTKHREIIQARRGKGYYIRGTYTRNNIDFANDILHISDLGFKEISLEPAVAKPGSPMAFTFDDLPEIFRQYEVLAIEMLRREKIGMGFNFYHFNLDLTSGPCVHKRIAGCGVGTQYMAVTPTGKLYPCHQFIGNKSFEIGSVQQGITNEKLRKDFGKWNIYTRLECQTCWARFYCSGGCASNAYNETGLIEGVYKIGCEMFKKRIECAIMLKVAGAERT